MQPSLIVGDRVATASPCQMDVHGTDDKFPHNRGKVRVSINLPVYPGGVSKRGAIVSDTAEGTRRDFLYVATGAASAVGAGAVVWPLIDQMNPSADVLALASIEVDVADVEPGSQITVKWLGKPVFIRRRTEEEIAAARDVSSPRRARVNTRTRCSAPARRTPSSGRTARTGWASPARRTGSS